MVRLALERDPQVTLVQIAKDFGIHVGRLDKVVAPSPYRGGRETRTHPLRVSRVARVEEA